MGASVQVHVLSIVVFLPAATAVALLAASVITAAMRLPRMPPVVWRTFGFAGSALTFGFATIGLWTGFDTEYIGLQFVEYAPWMPGIGLNYFVGIDGIGLAFVCLVALLFPVALLASWQELSDRLPQFVFAMLLLETSLLGSLAAQNLLQFQLFFEFSLLPLFLVIGGWGGGRSVFAATRMLLFAWLGSAFFGIGVLVLLQLNLEQAGVANLDLVSMPGAVGRALQETSIAASPDATTPFWRTQSGLFFAFALAFAIRLPIVPLHGWLADAQTEAGTPGSVVLAGGALGVGAYGFVRFVFPLLPIAVDRYAPILAVAGLIGILYGASLAMVQKDVKRLIAYSSIAQLGFVVLGVSAVNVKGVTGGIIQAISHGLMTAGLLVLVGFLYKRRGTRDIAAFGGLAKPMPVCAAFFGVLTFSGIGLPAFAGFVGELLVLLGSFERQPGLSMLAVPGLVLIASYLLWLLRRIFLGAVSVPENRGLIDLDRRERLAIAAIALPLLWIGLHPNPLLRRVEPAVLDVLHVMEQRRNAVPEIEAVAPDEEVLTRLDAPPAGAEEG